MERILKILGDNHSSSSPAVLNNNEFDAAVYTRNGEVFVFLQGLDLPLSTGSKHQQQQIIDAIVSGDYKIDPNFNPDE